MRALFLAGCILLSILLTSCANAKRRQDPVVVPVDQELEKFAKASCIYWFFKKKGYDLDDIEAVTDRMVEIGSYRPATYARIAKLMKEYRPRILSKHNNDVDLLKCFYMNRDSEFMYEVLKER